MTGWDRFGRVGGPLTGAGSDALRFAVPDQHAAERRELIEVLAPRLHAIGTTGLSHFDRLSDCLAVQTGFLELREVRIVEPVTRPFSPPPPVLWVALDEITLVGQREPGTSPSRGGEGVRVPKVKRAVTILTSTLVVTGYVYLHLDGTLHSLLEASESGFIPMSSVEVRDAGTDREVGTYGFALLGRRSALAVAEAADAEADTTAIPGVPAG